MNILLAVIGAGLLVSALVYFRGPVEPVTPPDQPLTVSLSPSTLGVLKRLESPVEIRFYSLLDPASVPDAVMAYAGRVSQLLAAYESAGSGSITVQRVDALSDLHARAASADGLQAFNVSQGEPCYLGIAVAGPDRKESLPLLSPEWEQALEADLSRAIARAAQAGPPRALTRPSEESMAAVEAVKRAIPNLQQVPQEEAARRLRQQALEQAQAMARASEAKIKEAEHRFSQAQQSGNEAEQQAALKELQQLQNEKIARLQEIAAQTQARLEALNQLKQESQ